MLYSVYKNSRQIGNRSLFCEAPQCTLLFFIKIGCFGNCNLEKTEKMRNLKLQYWGGVSFTTSEICLARKT